MGCPIRKFPDQSLFAAPRDLSQRTTSFIASQRQGIRQIPFWHLIYARNQKTESVTGDQSTVTRGLTLSGAALLNATTVPFLIRKDQFCFKHIREPRGQAKGSRLVLTENRRRTTDDGRNNLTAASCIAPFAISFPRPDALPLHDVNFRKRKTERARRISHLSRSAQPLFPKIPLSRRALQPSRETRDLQTDVSSEYFRPPEKPFSVFLFVFYFRLPASARCARLVEPDGIEPTTSCLQSTRSPN